MLKTIHPTWFNVILTAALVLVIFTAYKYVFICFHENNTKFKGLSIKTAANKYENLKRTLKSIKESCGDVCNHRIDGQPDNQYFDFVEKDINCMALFTNPDIDANSEFEYPLSEIPQWLLADYNYGGYVPISYYYRDDTERTKIKNGQIKHLQWTKNFTDLLEYEIQIKKFKGPYGYSSVETLDTFFKEHIKLAGKNVIVIGSETPWIEIMALMYDAKTVTSVDYRKIECEDPRIQVMSNSEMIERYLSGTLIKFDVVISFSSLEHSGLGRYGDNLNPWGDLISMARAYCVSQPDARALIGIPVGPKDKVVFNSHKTYGPIMLMNMFANWKLEYTNSDLDKYFEGCDWCYQPLFVLRKF